MQGSQHSTAPRIFFCGDPHGGFQHIVEAVHEHRPAAIVLLGDVQVKRPLEQELEAILDMTEVWWIHGNHDTDSVADYDHLFGSALADRNLHGRVVNVAGVRIAGLGGIFRSQVWMPPDPPAHETSDSYLANCGKGNWWRGGLPRKHRSSIFPSEYRMLLGEQADVLVTHEAPSCHRHGFPEIDRLAQHLGAKQIVHGHHHQSIDYPETAGRVPFAAYGVGFRDIRDQDGKMILLHEFEKTNTRGIL